MLLEFRGKGNRWSKMIKKSFGYFNVKEYNHLNHKWKIHGFYSVYGAESENFWNAMLRTTATFIDGVKAKYPSIAVIHGAACVSSDRKNIIVFVGKSGVGKSTACKILSENGMKVITEDTIFLDTKKGAIIPFPKPIVLKDGKKIPKKILIVEFEKKPVKIKKNNTYIIILRKEIKDKGRLMQFIRHAKKFLNPSSLSRISKNLPSPKIKISSDAIPLTPLECSQGIIRIIKQTNNIKRIDKKKLIQVLSKAVFLEYK